MKESLLNKLDMINDRFDELSALLSDQTIINDQKKENKNYFYNL